MAPLWSRILSRHSTIVCSNYSIVLKMHSLNTKLFEATWNVNRSFLSLPRPLSSRLFPPPFSFLSKIISLPDLRFITIFRKTWICFNWILTKFNCRIPRLIFQSFSLTLLFFSFCSPSFPSTSFPLPLRPPLSRSRHFVYSVRFIETCQTSESKSTARNCKFRERKRNG